MISCSDTTLIYRSYTLARKAHWAANRIQLVYRISSECHRVTWRQVIFEAIALTCLLSRKVIRYIRFPNLFTTILNKLTSSHREVSFSGHCKCGPIQKKLGIWCIQFLEHNWLIVVRLGRKRKLNQSRLNNPNMCKRCWSSEPARLLYGVCSNANRNKVGLYQQIYSQTSDSIMTCYLNCIVANGIGCLSVNLVIRCDFISARVRTYAILFLRIQSR